MHKIIQGIRYTSGDKVCCTFDSGLQVIGTLHIETGPDRTWICHDDPNKNGSESPNKWGHRFSWYFNYLDGRYTDEVTGIRPFNSDLKYKDPVVQEELSRFLGMQGNQHDLWLVARACLKPFEDYDRYELSDKPGFIRLSGKTKTEKGLFEKNCEIKLSRFISKMSEALAKAGAPTGIDDKFVERVHNNLVAFQSGEYLKVEYLTGRAIEEGYTKDKYSESATGTLHKSCMTDKLDCIGIYTGNKSVSLAVIRSDVGIEARCLVWSFDGKRYYDRIYYTFEWVATALEKKLVADGCKRLQSCRAVKSVKLERHEFDKYPYLDTFKFLSPSEGRLYFSKNWQLLPPGKYRVLTHADGSYVEHTISS
jgi:hypothetical protein